MSPKRSIRRDHASNPGLASQLSHFNLPAEDSPGDQNDLATLNEILWLNPDILVNFKQNLICQGMWPQSDNAASSNSSSDQAAGDSSGSGERPASSNTSNPIEETRQYRSRNVPADQGSDESATAQDDKTSGGSTMAPGPATKEGDSSGSSAAGNAGRNQSVRDKGEAWLINNARDKDNDGQSSDASAKGKDSENSEVSTPAPSSSGAVAGSSGCMGDAGSSAGTSSSAHRWEYNKPGVSTPLQEVDGENGWDDLGLQPLQDLAELGMDCLPQDAFVWVQGEDAPKATIELQPGDKVSCFDVLGKIVTYAEVADVRVDDEPVEWVHIEMADGTKTTLTTDHQVQLSGKHATGEVVKAGDIEPQKSRIMVHRVATRAVRVSKVTRVPPGLMNPSGRVAVTIKQPDRHAILVASAGQGGEDGRGREDVHLVAVGSADLTPKPCGGVRPRVHPAVPLIFPEEVGRRSHSWPPSAGSRLELSVAAPCLPPPQKSRAGSSSCFGQDSSTGSYQDSSSETSSEGYAMVLLPWVLPNSSPDAPRAASLIPPRGVSELLRARMAGWPSVGSSGHPDSCRPCYFAHRGLCTAGEWCPRCHGQHRKCNGKLLPVRPRPDRDESEGR